MTRIKEEKKLNMQAARASKTRRGMREAIVDLSSLNGSGVVGRYLQL